MAGSAATTSTSAMEGKNCTARYTAAASKKASGASRVVRMGATLRYRSPYPRSMMPDPTPVVMAPTAHNSTCGAPGRVADAKHKVPMHVHMGPAKRKILVPVMNTLYLRIKAQENRSAHRHRVEKRKAAGGSASPFHVTTLVAAPRNMRYTHARMRENPNMRKLNRLESGTSCRRSSAFSSIPLKDKSPPGFDLTCGGHYTPLWSLFFALRGKSLLQNAQKSASTGEIMNNA